MRDGFGGQHRHQCDYFFKLSGPIILRCFLRQPIIINDYFTIITINVPTINRSDASLKSICDLLEQQFFEVNELIQNIFGLQESFEID